MEIGEKLTFMIRKFRRIQMRSVLLVVLLMLSTKSYGAEIRLYCDGDLYRYSSNLFQKNVFIREDAEWKQHCEVKFRTAENCSTKITDKGSISEAYKFVTYKDQSNFGKNLKVGTHYKVLQKIIIDFEKSEMIDHLWVEESGSFIEDLSRRTIGCKSGD